MARLNLILLSAALMLMLYKVTAQTPQTYKPTEVQLLKLQVAQRDAALAQRDYLDASKKYQDAVVALRSMGEQFRKDNGWPDTIHFDADTLTYSMPTPPAPSTKGATAQ